MDHENIYKRVGFTIEDNIIKGYPKPYCMKTHNLGQVILDVLSSNPHHVSQIESETGKQTTFAEMRDSSIRCALWLQKQGISSNDVVSICTDNQLDAYIPELATFYVGAAHNPWHHDVALKSARHLIQLVRPKVMFTCENAAETLAEAAKLEGIDTKIVVFGKHSSFESLSDVMKQQQTEEVENFRVKAVENPDDVALIVFSSGSSGLPKGIVHSYNTFSKNILRFARLPEKSDVMLWYTSPYWLTAVYFTLQLYLLQSTRILHAKFDPEETCRVIEKHKITWIFITTDMINVFNKSEVFKKHKVESLKLIQTGGSKINREVFEEFQNSIPHTLILQGYGMCELGGTATMQTEKRKRVDSGGFVIEHVQVKMVDLTTGEALGPNQSGELYCKSPTMMLGYYRNPEATKETIDEDGWIHSGDKAYYDEDGEVFIVERLKQVMKFRAYHISPSEIEAVLLSHPAVMEVAVVPLPHELDGERPMAFVAKAPGSEVTEDELIELSATLGEYKKLWGGVKFLEELPHTPSGKIAKVELIEMAKALAKK
ncbi:4-coumarate--CoA ligase 1 [Nasonia vitripennis]|uniref:Luciferin 4-monooxygenase n=1 Tax=Nasonia vitripennis TaxID=7425 RepID=A0A7M7LKS2_NASVI|nr:4-coumarate--CoA ligase 1 [Nasonia vitripennis]XP_008207243.1 4-coumarate--CoA ligase 1 [Nasonia vitripennis]XP_032456400.1 4-coumarate--CoA ligase 1 [Nasonia vitripennis]